MFSTMNAGTVPQPGSFADYVSIAMAGAATIIYLSRGTFWDKPDPYHHVWFKRLGEGQAAIPKPTRNIAEKVQESNKNLLIFWGSQSGTAEGFAVALARDFELRFALSTLAANLDDYDPQTIQSLPKNLPVIFILSTFGDGDPPDNTATFWQWITSSKSDINLAGLRYSAFGLGNSAYKYYNNVVDVTVEKLEQAGARELLPVGRADDINGGTQEDFLDWKAKLIKVIQQELHLEQRDMPFIPETSVIMDDSLSLADLHLGRPLRQNSNRLNDTRNISAIVSLPITHVTRTTSPSGKVNLHLELDISVSSTLRYNTGDHLAVFPVNPAEEVEMLVKGLNAMDQAETPLLIKPMGADKKGRLPSPTNLLTLLRHYLEICAPVSREVVEQLREFAPTKDAAEYLSSLSRDKQTYSQVLGTTHITFGRLLHLAAPGSHWSRLPLSFLLEKIAPMQPRYYSISSSNAVSSRRVSIMAGVECYRPENNQNVEIKGVTTGYLSALSQNSENEAKLCSSNSAITASTDLKSQEIFAFIRKTTFKLPADSQTPIIMIAVGTGIAPFRAFVQERDRMKRVGKAVGRMILLFGCREHGPDEIYKEDFEEAQKNLGQLLEVVRVYSREKHEPKRYVQHIVMQRKNEICDMMENAGAKVFLCGLASMAREVKDIILEVMKERRQWDESEVRAYAESLKRMGTWHEDVWG